MVPYHEWRSSTVTVKCKLISFGTLVICHMYIIRHRDSDSERYVFKLFTLVVYFSYKLRAIYISTALTFNINFDWTFV